MLRISTCFSPHPLSRPSRCLAPGRTQWPDLLELHDRVLGLPGIKAYLEGPQRPQAMSPFMRQFLEAQR